MNVFLRVKCIPDHCKGNVQNKQGLNGNIMCVSFIFLKRKKKKGHLRQRFNLLRLINTSRRLGQYKLAYLTSHLVST